MKVSYDGVSSNLEEVPHMIFVIFQLLGVYHHLPLDVAGGSVYVYFSRQSVNPLISTLSIDSISTDLNGTRIGCSSLDSSESVMTVIHVIGGKQFMSTSCRAIILYFTASFL